MDSAVGKGREVERGVKEKVEETKEKGEEVEKAEGVFEGVRRSGQDVYRVATAIPTGTVSKVKEWVGFNSSAETSSEPAKDDKASVGGQGEESGSGGGEQERGRCACCEGAADCGVEEL